MPIKRLPKCKSEDDFVSICKDILGLKYRKEFYIYGRSGQKQNGIDIYSKDAKGYILAQCKNYLSDTSVKSFVPQIKKDIELAVKQENLIPISHFIAMTALNRDTAIQNEIEQITNQYNFSILIMFWEDIEDWLFEDTFVLNKHYSDYINIRNEALESLNTIMAGLHDLIKCAQELYRTRPVSQPVPIKIFNTCVKMVNIALNIEQLRNKFFVPFNIFGILEIFDYVISCISDINEEYGYLEVVAEVPFFNGQKYHRLVDNALKYFNERENAQGFVEKCKEGMKRIEEIL